MPMGTLRTGEAARFPPTSLTPFLSEFSSAPSEAADSKLRIWGPEYSCVTFMVDHYPSLTRQTFDRAFVSLISTPASISRADEQELGL